jgi:hypothetical protein
MIVQVLPLVYSDYKFYYNFILISLHLEIIVYI